jgi:hypothetical protein
MTGNSKSGETKRKAVSPFLFITIATLFSPFNLAILQALA